MDPLHVLVVDDEQDLRDGSERILIRMGFRVSKAARGDEGLKIIEQEPVAIVLLDLKMPGMDGMEVLERIKKINEEIVVIVITGFATVETAIEAMKMGAYDFIPKPFEPDHLRIVVRRAQERVHLFNEAEQLEKERQRTLADLDAEKSRTRTIIEALPSGVVVTNTEGVVVLMNPAFLWCLGLDAEMKPGREIEHYSNDEGFCRMVRELSHGGCENMKEPPTYEFALPDNKFLLAEGQAIVNEEDDCLGAVVILVDVTALKALDQLKSEFVAKVSHELRSPLSTIHEQLVMVEKKPTKDQYILSRAREKTQGLISLIGDLLDLSRIEAGNMGAVAKPVSLAELLANIVDFIGAQAQGRNQTLSLELPEIALPDVVADPMALESIFGNLIANAIKYTQEGGTIKVEVEQVDSQIQVAVIDNGYGMEARQLEKIFDKFYRVKNEKTRYITGTGLGLSIVKSLVEKLNGSITVASEPDKGTTFTVRLPAAAASGNGSQR
ncbi:MAG: response regulator [Deltaproteobacteria bacterium]|nr:response regulator [Candidatus Anaeroferrophillus wilburensis]MBN2889727.1 response regulator [Deltaproteobacteria bacterium]